MTLRGSMIIAPDRRENMEVIALRLEKVEENLRAVQHLIYGMFATVVGGVVVGIIVELVKGRGL